MRAVVVVVVVVAVVDVVVVVEVVVGVVVVVDGEVSGVRRHGVDHGDGVEWAEIGQ